MKTTLAIEEAAQLFLAIIGLYLQPIHVAWWLWPVVFLSPDISMVGYFVNTKIGAGCYNLVHHKATAIACIAIGWKLSSPELQFIGLILYGHSSFDRMLGYGLKYRDSFKHTHLGLTGKGKKQLTTV